MPLGRALISATLALSLSACGGGGGGGNTGSGAPGGSSGGGGGTGTADCSLGARQDWVLQQLDEWYLFPELLDRSVSPSSHGTVQSYIDALVAPARAQSRDRFFTYITSIAEENELINSGASAGFGFRLAYDTASSRVFVIEVFETAPAYPAGFDRGDQLLTIGGQSVTSLMNSGGPAAVIQALGPNTAGTARDFTFRDTSGVERNATVTKAEYQLDPISDRYGVRVFDNGGTPVGYVNLRTFIVEDAGTQLRQAFANFRAQGVTEVILDLRYNGGGLVSVAELLGDLLGANRTGEVFSNTQFRESKAAENSTDLFTGQSEAIPALQIAVIGTDATASASELVTNSMLAYLGSDIALVGTDTYGKPVGQIALDRSACDDRLRAVAFRTTNADGQGDYYTGLADVMQATCRAEDEIAAPLGDPSEASIAQALAYLRGTSCTAIAAAPSGEPTVRAVERRRELLQPRMPTPAQREIPGLF